VTRAMSRRQLLQEGGIVVAAVMAGQTVTLGAARAEDVLIIDAASPQAGDIARGLGMHHARIIPLSGDPIRFWRDERQRLSGRVAGVTRWSDFLLLRELAYEERLRVSGETHHSIGGGALLVSFIIA
jgi:hypothetical protein